jgi:hypothetical protein
MPVFRVLSRALTASPLPGLCVPAQPPPKPLQGSMNVFRVIGPGQQLVDPPEPPRELRLSKETISNRMARARSLLRPDGAVITV